MPRISLCDLPGDIYPLRTRNDTLTLLAQADGCATKTEAHKILLEQSIRDIPVSAAMPLLLLRFEHGIKSPFQNTLLNYFSLYACVYQSFCSDPLHQIRQGVWGQHLWKWCKEVYLSSPELRELDEMYTIGLSLCIVC